MKPHVYTSQEVARLLGVSPSSILFWIERGVLPCYRTPGGHRRIVRGALVRFLRDQGMPVPTELVGISRLLIIDRDVAFPRTVKRLLRRAAFRVDVEAAQRPVDALVKVVTSSPDAILLDTHMLGIDGVDLCKRFRASAASAHIRVIGIAERPSPGLERSYERAGAAGFLTKPVEPGKLLAALGLAGS